MKRTPLRPSLEPIPRYTPLPKGQRPPRPRKLDPKKRRWAKHRNDAFREWVREQPCALAGCFLRGDIHCAHVKARGAGGGDVGNCIPLCAEHHRYQHDVGIRTFQRDTGSDLPLLAKLYGERWVADHPEDAA